MNKEKKIKILKKRLQEANTRRIELYNDLIGAIYKLPEGELKRNLMKKYPASLLRGLLFSQPSYYKAMVEKYGNEGFVWPFGATYVDVKKKANEEENH